MAHTFQIGHIHFFPGLFVALFLLQACEEKTDVNIQGQLPDLIVVDGLITNEKKAHEIKITRPVNKLNAPAEPVSGAYVAIHDGDTTIFPEEKKQGSYFTHPEFRAVFTKRYFLYITYNGQEYSAVTTMVPVTPFEPLTYVPAEDSSGMYKIQWNEDAYDDDESAMWHVLIYPPGYHNSSIHPVDTDIKKLVYYTIFSVDVNRMFAPDKREELFPGGSIIVQKKYSLNDEHASFVRSLLSETEWRGGLFDVYHANVETNLSEGAVGFFGACTVLSDTIYVSP